MKMTNLKKRKKGSIERDVLIWWILILIAFLIVISAFLGFSEAGRGAIEHIKNIFRFGI